MQLIYRAQGFNDRPQAIPHPEPLVLNWRYGINL
jgi:hypothetical protein